MPDDPRDLLAINRANWDARTAVHVGSAFYDRAGFLAGRDPIPAVEQEELGEVRGLDLIHLQCHFGMDTLGWARRGARVTGVDFSPRAIREAQALALDAGLSARFVEAEVTQAPAAVGGETFDVVYVNVGSLEWLPDLGPWASAVRALIRPGGVLYLRDAHPMLYTLEERGAELVLAHPYFATGAPLTFDEAVTYTEGTVTSPVHYVWPHPLSEVLAAIATAGLVLEQFREHPFADWRALPSAILGPDRMYRLPAPWAERAPMTYSLRARAPR